jgi:hypothetical protein
VYRLRAPMRRQLSRTEYSKTERSVCWQYEVVCHLRRYCRRGCPQKDFPEEDRLTRGIQRKNVAAPSIPPPRYKSSMSEFHGHNSLHAEESSKNKEKLVTIYTGARIKISRQVITAGLPESDLTTPCRWHQGRFALL